MDKQWFNDEMNKIEVPEMEIQHAIKSGISKAQKHYSTKRLFKRMRVPLISASILFGVLGSGFIVPQMSQVLAEVPLIGKLYTTLKDPIGKKLVEKNLVKEINQKAISNGVPIIINSVYFDGARISIAYTVNKPNISPEDFNYKYKIADGSDKWHKSYQASDLRKTSKGLVSQILIDYPEKTLPKNMKLPLEISSIGKVKGTWKFQIPLDQLSFQRRNISQSIKSKDKKHTIHFESIILGNESSTIDYKAIHSLEGKNDLTRIDKITDDKGNEIPLLSSGTEFSKKQNRKSIESEERSVFEKIPKNTLFINIYPYVREVETHSVYPINTATPFVMKSKRNNLALKIREIHFKENQNKLIVLFQLNHVDKSKKLEQVVNFIESINLEDSSMTDQEVIPLGHMIKGNDTDIIDQKNLLFKSTFELSELDNFSLDNYSFSVPFSYLLPEKVFPPIKVRLK